MSYLKTLSLVLLCAEFVGCDYRPFKYEATGQLLFPSREPAVGITLLLDSSEKPTRPPAMPLDYVTEHCTVTGANGRFTANWQSSDMYSGMNIIFPPAPELREIYLWIKQGSAWHFVSIQPNTQCQMHPFPGGRHIDLPPIELPHPATLPSP